ncbi:HlyD family secretion protein [Legionella dresdenensis]|uniref:HlyD family secretion protein n=1 Tax=Legionella dresdenensis TaxID=450200 RepID=A0ABV8CEN3_9GAMM
MNTNNLFRKEALENHGNHFLGTSFINTPVNYIVLAAGFCILMLLIIAFLVFADFSDKYTVRGFITSSKGIINILSSKSGVITKVYVHANQKVHKGDLLLLFSSEQDLLSRESIKINKQFRKRNTLVKQEIRLKKAEITALKTLLDNKYIARTLYNEKYNQLLQLEREKSQIELERARYEQEKNFAIRAPADGSVANVLFKEGQYVAVNKPLLKILPADASYIAELCIPVEKSGFLARKNNVYLQFDAYPYQRFGVYQAAIAEISPGIIMSDDEEEKPIHVGQPYYKVLANLSQDCVFVYGKPRHLQHGMTFTAVLTGSHRKVWQWLLDPVFSFYGGHSV